MGTLRTLSPGDNISVALRNCSEEATAWLPLLSPGNSFCIHPAIQFCIQFLYTQGYSTHKFETKGAGSLNIKDYWYVRKTRYQAKEFSILPCISSVQFSRSVMSDSVPPPWIAARQASLYLNNSQSSLRFTSIESVMPSSHLILCRPLLLLPPIPPSIRVFSNESTLRMRWPKYWSFSFSIIPSNEHPGLISFRMHWLDLLAVQGTLKSLLQHHSSKASILQCSTFFTVQLSHPYMTTGKTIALTRRTFVGKVMSLLLNMLSRLVITFLPRSNSLLISWLQSPSAVILEPQKIKSATVSTVSPSISHEVMGPDAMIFVFWRLSFKSAFSLSSYTFIKRLFSSSSLSAISVVSSAYLSNLLSFSF